MRRYVCCKHQMQIKINEFINLPAILFLSDINECEDQKHNRCPDKSDCENTEGSYTCNSRKSRLKIAIIGMSIYIYIYIGYISYTFSLLH